MHLKRQMLLVGLLAGMVFLQCKTPQWHEVLELTASGFADKEVVSYKFDNIVTEGVSGLEPLKILYSGTFAFSVQTGYELPGYHLYKIQKGIHPRFNMEHELQYLFDGKTFYYQNIAPVITQYDSIPVDSVDIDRLISVSSDHLPDLLHGFMNASQRYELISQADTLYKGSACYNFILKDKEFDFINTVIIRKDDLLPVYLKIVYNEFQPFIVENYFYDFEFPDSFGYSIVKPDHSLSSSEETRTDIFIKGEKMPRLISRSLDGDLLDTESKDYKVILWGFSSLFCGPCLASHPNISSLFERLSAVESLGFVVCHPSDPEERLIQYVKAKNVNYPIFLKPEDFETWRYKIAFPTFLIIDENKTIVHKHVGGISPEIADQFESLIKSLY